jgi:flagellar basal-body rod protein FlgF
MGPQGIYSLVSRGKVLEKQMDAVANNLANVDTVGYKEDQPTFQQILAHSVGVAPESDEETFVANEHIAPYSGVGNSFVAIGDMGKDFTKGRPTPTGNDLDFALTTDQGFFSVQAPQGERFTRAGNFRINQNNQLVTADGLPVNGKEGPLVLKGENIQVGEDGSILVDGKPSGGMRIVTFPFPERLQKLGSGLFAPVDAANTARTLEEVKLAQGFVESSNVNPVREMTKMIEANRAYTQMQKALNVADEMNQRAISLAQV